MEIDSKLEYIFIVCFIQKIQPDSFAFPKTVSTQEHRHGRANTPGEEG